MGNICERSLALLPEKRPTATMLHSEISSWHVPCRKSKKNQMLQPRVQEQCEEQPHPSGSQERIDEQPHQQQQDEQQKQKHQQQEHEQRGHTWEQGMKVLQSLIEAESSSRLVSADFLPAVPEDAVLDD